jgi:predicted aspartyl protease
VPPFLYPITVSGPYGQYTVEAVVDPGATFTIIPTPALVEMGIEPVRVVRVREPGGSTGFRRLGRALTAVAGEEDVAPVLFGEPGRPAVLGKVTLDLLLLRADAEAGAIVPIEASFGTGMLEGDANEIRRQSGPGALTNEL